MILDVDPDTTRGSVGVQRDFGVGLRELKGVLQQVPSGREEHFPVHIECKTRVNIADRKTTLSRTRLKRSKVMNLDRFDVDRDQLAMRIAIGVVGARLASSCAMAFIVEWHREIRPDGPMPLPLGNHGYPAGFVPCKVWSLGR
jgi:hypothetical protein